MFATLVRKEIAETVLDLRFVLATLPEMVYTYPGVAQALQAGWPDLLLLGFCGVLFGSLAFLRLSKYDVR